MKKTFFSFTFIIFLLAFGIFIFKGVSAQSMIIDGLKTQISNTNISIQQLEEEILKHEKDLVETRNEKKTLSNEIYSLDITRKKLGSEISVTQTRIDSANLNINKLEIEVAELQSLISTNREIIKRALRDMNQAESATLLEIFLLNDNFSDFFTEIQNLESIQDNIHKRLKELRDQKTALTGAKEEEVSHKENLDGLKGKLGDQKYVADVNRRETNNLLAETKNEESRFQNLIIDKLALKRAFEAEIQEYESQLRVAIDPNSLPQSGMGVFSWPVKSVYLTQRFGKTVDAKRLYASGTHNGIDLGVTRGSEINAPHGGTIVATGDTDQACPGASYGKWILMEHGNGLSTLYAHLSHISSTAGQTYKRGETIGYSGNTGYSTGPHLHFTVFATVGVKVETRASRACNGSIYTIPLAPTNAYLDPLEYLPQL